jgi:hypothetical protein
MTYQYQKLNDDTMRLLHPERISDNILSFRISSFPRTCAPPYTAVSYTWGNDEPDQKIYVNERPFPVRCNLWSLLYYLGHYAGKGGTGWRYLWVDAICIDQTNDLERNAQVRLMDKIYQSAVSVSVWLGLPPVPEYMHETIMNYHEPILRMDVEGFDWFDSVKDLANRPYWRRFWVIQEFLLGREVHLFCGSSRVDWADFKDLLGNQTGTAYYLQANFDHSKHESGTWAAWPLVKGRHPDKHPEFQQTLYELLINHGKSECKDPRDRVFALLGLVTHDERVWLDQFFPDYTMDEDDVFIVALAHIRQMNFEVDNSNYRHILSCLAVDCESRQKRILKRAAEFDCLGGIPPSSLFFSDTIDDHKLWNWAEDTQIDSNHLSPFQYLKGLWSTWSRA